MTPEQKSLIRSSFQRLMAAPDLLAQTFYRRLFALAPDTQALFQTNMQEQGKKFVAMLQAALEYVEFLDKMVPALWQMGKRHGGYGVQPEHYDAVRTALLDAMRERDGEAFTFETEVAWGELCDLMAAIMQQAASEGIVPRSARPMRERKE